MKCLGKPERGRIAGIASSRFSRSRESRVRAGSLYLLFLILCFTMGSCASKEVYIPVAERAALESQGAGALGPDSSVEAGRGNGGEGPRGVIEEGIAGDPNRDSEGSLRTKGLITDIYFDFDSYALRNQDLAGLNGLSAWLKVNKRSALLVEGHCDERGSIEYNMALGQKRAEAVKEHLLALGVEAGRIRTISYGKETPVDSGHSEDSWAKNRRAHMKIDQR
jgi:peptidoglycan-associated lipoprotein